MKHRIVVMSHARQANMPKMASLLPPGFTVFVDPLEKHNYADVCKEHGLELVLHQRKNRNPVSIRQDILNTFKEESIVFVDDDLKRVACLVGQKPRWYDEPGDIEAIIGQGLDAVEDMDTSFYGWNRNPNPMYFQGFAPFTLVKNFLAGAFIVRNRRFAFDELVSFGADVDITLQGLLKERIVMFDRRFYWDFGATGKGDGGLQNLRTAQAHETNVKYLTGKWGPHCDFNNDRASGKGKEKQTTGIHFNITRKNHMGRN